MLISKHKLAIFGGTRVRVKEFRSLPYVTQEMKVKLIEMIDSHCFSQFIGSPIAGTRELLDASSDNIAKISEDVSFFGGKRVRDFEAKWAEYFETSHAVTVNSATSGLTAAVLASGIRSGNEVIMTPFSFTATASSVVSANAVPVFCDIDLETFCIDPNLIEDLVGTKTAAVMPVHWNGNGSGIEEIVSIGKDKDLIVIEDAAQAPGIRVRGRVLGTFGDVGVFSLNQPKNIMTGEGGVVVTKDSQIGRKLRLIRNHGETVMDSTDTLDRNRNVVGFNFRLTELAAELGIQQLGALHKLNTIRKENYHYLVRGLTGCCGEMMVPQKIEDLASYAPYHIGFRWLTDKSGVHRNVIARVLREEGIPISTGFSRLMCDHPLFHQRAAYSLQQSRFDYRKVHIPNARRLFDEQYIGFSQVGWPNTTEDMDDIIRAFEKITHNIDRLRTEQLSDISDHFISGR